MKTIVKFENTIKCIQGQNWKPKSLLIARELALVRGPDRRFFRHVIDWVGLESGLNFLKSLLRNLLRRDHERSNRDEFTSINRNQEFISGVRVSSLIKE